MCLLFLLGNDKIFKFSNKTKRKLTIAHLPHVKQLTLKKKTATTYHTALNYV